VQRCGPTSLGVAQKRLLTLMRSICFGRIEGLQIRCGQPVLDPPPRIIREIKLGSTDNQSNKSDYQEMRQVRELIALFQQIGDGVVDCIEIRHGLPFRVVITDRLVGKEA
jgi:hypothetical protein